MTNHSRRRSPRSTGPGRPSNREERQRQIADALLAVMSRTGYANATIAAVAREAELAPGLLHHHFGSKQAILVALVDRLRSGLEARIAARKASAAREPLAQLHALLDAHVALGPDADARAVTAWVLVGAEAVRDREVRALHTAATRAALARLDAALRACGLNAARARDGAAVLLSAIEGAYQLSATSPGLLPRGFASPMLHALADALVARKEKHP
jgi:TetR/AcrR family transcriptional repressor of bet genes